MFISLQEELARRHIALRLVEARSSVRDMLRLEGVEDKVGRIDRTRSLADIVAELSIGHTASPSGTHV